MQKVNRHPTIEQMLKVPFEHRAELFKNAVEHAAKRFMVELDAAYIQPYHDYHTLTQEE